MSRLPEGPSRRPYALVLVLSGLVGIGGGLVAAAVHAVLELATNAVWDDLVPRALDHGALGPALFVVPVAAGVVVGLVLRAWGSPGEIAAVVDDIHLKHGRLELRATPAMAATSFATIVGGGSLGPEAPLVQIVGSLASTLADRLRLRDEEVRTLTLSGMSAALAAFFGSPLGGALFALEIPHRRGLEYFEALLPAAVSGTVSHVVFAELVGEWGAPIALAGGPRVGLAAFATAVGLGLVGALVAAVFQRVLHATGALFGPLEKRPVLRAALGGLALGAIALPFAPPFPVMPFFFGERQIPSVLGAASALVDGHGALAVSGVFVVLALAKMLAIATTVHSGFRGGFIFPLFFVGAAVGVAIATASRGGIDPTLAALCTMAAVNVAVTKTPLGTTVVVAGFAAPSLLPLVLASSLVGFAASTRVSVIRTQRGRSPLVDTLAPDPSPDGAGPSLPPGTPTEA